MYNVADELEERADDIPIRHVKDLLLDHLTLVVKKKPVYAATSVEVRADNEVDIEIRAFENEISLTDSSTPNNSYYSSYEDRIKKL